jgi:hypothetical protein
MEPASGTISKFGKDQLELPKGWFVIKSQELPNTGFEPTYHSSSKP